MFRQLLGAFKASPLASGKAPQLTKAFPMNFIGVRMNELGALNFMNITFSYRLGPMSVIQCFFFVFALLIKLFIFVSWFEAIFMQQ